MKNILIIPILLFSIATFAQGKATVKVPGGGGIAGSDSAYRKAISATGEGGSYDPATGILTLKGIKIFRVTDYGALPDDNLDDSYGIQLALNLAGVYSGVVYFPQPRNTNGYHYYVDNALVTSLDGVNPNCQIYIPLATAGGSMPTVSLLGEVAPNFSTEGIAALERNNQGVIIESRINGTGALPAVFGTPWYANAATGLRNYTKVKMENLIVRTKTIDDNGADIAGTMSGVNFARLIQFETRDVKADVSSSLTNSLRPQNETYGFIFPDVNNKVNVASEGDISAECYMYGIQPGEHWTAAHVGAYGCEYGVKITDGYHNYSIQHFTAEVNRNNILLAGTMHGIITTYETEHYTSSDKWFQFQKDIVYQSGNSQLTIMRSNVVLSGIGRPAMNSTTAFISDDNADYTIFSGHGQNLVYNKLQLSNTISAEPYLAKLATDGYAVPSEHAAAINQFAAELSAAGITKDNFYRIGIHYGNALTSTLNFINPEHTPAAFDATPNGSLVFTPYGNAGNGVNAYLNTNLNPFETMQNNNAGVTVLYRESGLSDVRMGGYSGSNSNVGISLNYEGNDYYFLGETVAEGSFIIVPAGPTNNINTVVRRSATDLEAYRDGASVGRSAIANTTTLPNGNMFLLARNGNSVPDIYQNATIEFDAWHTGAGFTSAKVAAFHTAIKNLMTALGR